MTDASRPSRRHNGGPPLDEPTLTAAGHCRNCRHWSAPSDGDLRAYEFYRLGLSHRRLKRPTGACDRVLLSAGRRATFGATPAEFGCGNFDTRPEPPRPRGGGFVTVWQDGRIAWEGSEEVMPAVFRQEELDLSNENHDRSASRSGRGSEKS